MYQLLQVVSKQVVGEKECPVVAFCKAQVKVVVAEEQKLLMQVKVFS